MAGPLDSLIPPSSAPASARCSRAACTATASAQVNWRNPRIHGVDRVKIWLACDEHLDFLADYLGSRDFPVEVTPVGVVLARVGAT